MDLLVEVGVEGVDGMVEGVVEVLVGVVDAVGGVWDLVVEEKVEVDDEELVENCGLNLRSRPLPPPLSTLSYIPSTPSTSSTLGPPLGIREVVEEVGKE